MPSHITHTILRRMLPAGVEGGGFACNGIGTTMNYGYSNNSVEFPSDTIAY
jgi:hypothetical protein